MQGHGFDPWFRKIPQEVEQLSLLPTATEPKHPGGGAPQQEKPPPGAAHAHLESSLCSNRDGCSHKSMNTSLTGQRVKNRHLPLGTPTDGQQTHEKVLKVTKHQGNKIQSHNCEYQLTSIRMAAIKETTNNKHCQGCRGTKTLIHCWWEPNLARSP